MATTPGGLPYPVGTDLVVDGDNAIRALAEGVEAQLTARYVISASAYIQGDANGLINVPVPAAWITAGLQVRSIVATVRHIPTQDVLTKITSLVVWDDVWPRPVGTPGVFLRARREDTHDWLVANPVAFHYMMTAAKPGIAADPVSGGPATPLPAPTPTPLPTPEEEEGESDV